MNLREKDEFGDGVTVEMAVADNDNVPAELPVWFDFVVLGGICLLAVIFFTAMYWGVTSWL